MTQLSPGPKSKSAVELAEGSLKRALVFALLALGATWPAVWLYAAEPVGSSASELVIAEELKELTDPTILTRRVWLETEWNKYRGGVNDVEETLGGLWAWRVSTNQDWAVRVKVPYEWHMAGDAADDSDENGLGDIKLATGTAFRLSERWRIGGGLELRMPTAEDDLGDRDWRLQEFGAVAWDATRWLTLSPSVEYNETLAERSGGSQQHYVEAFFPATFLLPHRWSVTPKYEAKVDFENNNYVTHSAKLQVAKQLRDLPLGFALSIKESFDGGDKEFQVNFIITWHFR